MEEMPPSGTLNKVHLPHTALDRGVGEQLVLQSDRIQTDVFVTLFRLSSSSDKTSTQFQTIYLGSNRFVANPISFGYSVK